MLQHQEEFPAKAVDRYKSTLALYKERLKTDPCMTLSSFCREIHTDYRTLNKWMNHHNIRVIDLKYEVTSNESNPINPNTFVQVVPRQQGISLGDNIRGVSITFPDGIKLALEESNINNVVNIICIYKDRMEGRIK